MQRKKKTKNSQDFFFLMSENFIIPLIEDRITEDDIDRITEVTDELRITEGA